MDNALQVSVPMQDWTALELVFTPSKLKLVRDYLTGEGGFASGDAWKSLRLTSRELASIAKHPAFDEHVLSRMAAYILGIAEVNRTQLASVKMFLEWKERYGKPTGPMDIEIDEEKPRSK